MGVHGHSLQGRTGRKKTILRVMVWGVQHISIIICRKIWEKFTELWGRVKYHDRLGEKKEASSLMNPSRSGLWWHGHSVHYDSLRCLTEKTHILFASWQTKNYWTIAHPWAWGQESWGYSSMKKNGKKSALLPFLSRECTAKLVCQMKFCLAFSHHWWLFSHSKQSKIENISHFPWRDRLY